MTTGAPTVHDARRAKIDELRRENFEAQVKAFDAGDTAKGRRLLRQSDQINALAETGRSR